MRRRLLWAGVGLALAIALVVAVLSIPAVVGIVQRVSDGVQPSGEAQPIATATLDGAGPGSLVTAMTMPGLSHTAAGRTMESARVTYRSSFGTKAEPTVVSGSVFTPKGPAPDGGWPVIAFGHGTTGIDEPCALSLSDSLLGQIAAVQTFTAKGYAVAVADYQGLGADGIHPYADSLTAGYNVIDAVRALRSTFKDVSTRWVGWGGSQGGGAVWAADEQASTYAPELDLLGAIVVSPVADMVGLVDKAQAGTLTNDQGPALQLIIESLARLNPDLNRDDYRHGAAAEYWDTLSACSGKLVNDRNAAIEKLTPKDFAPTTPEAAQRLRDLIGAYALPQRRLSAPLAVEYGGKDTFIDYPWTAAAIERACQLGGVLEWRFSPDKGHSEGDAAYELQWIADRFAGKRVTNECR
ncbi:lipase family protein [Mycolicibacterium sp.]|uniref:lipase family protein n=1 Tax=Mycolicibacterium sp. TaxID=2320850 RepID=UPI001A2DFBDD|nr:lipase family protein [Mycolicibacterium sp.]MBJ7339081.1 alpha/beta hydrolase [Mycolicibacterium sp.]